VAIPSTVPVCFGRKGIDVATNFTHCKIEIGAVDGRSGERMAEALRDELLAIRCELAAAHRTIPIVWLFRGILDGEFVATIYAYCTTAETGQLEEALKGAI